MCTSPLIIKYQSIDGNHAKLVPCGKCFECLKQKQNDYFVRIYEELTQASKACFLTLTYAPANVPYYEIDGKKYLTVYKQDVKDWLKRFRTNYERATGCKIGRYFLCSEYGPRTLRPHYHCIFFNMGKKDCAIALADWNRRFGYTMAKDIDYSSQKSLECSARYVAKYCTKGVFENPFRILSESGFVFQTVLEKSWCYVCETFGIVPYFFLVSDIYEIRKFSRWYRHKSVPRRVFRDLPRRGIETETRVDWKV